MVDVSSTGNATVTNLCKEIANRAVEDGVNYSREELETLFADTNYFNAGEKGKEQIQKQIDALEKTIKALKKEAEDLKKEIDSKNLKVENKSDQLADIVGKINTSTADYQKDMKNAARLSTREAIEAFKKGNGESFEQCFSDALNKKLNNMGLDVGAIKALYAQYDAIKGTISPIMNDIQKYLNEVKTIQGKLDSTNATINLLTKTKNNMTDTIKGAYKNVDTDNKIPIFSGAKAELANELLGKYTSRYDVQGDAEKNGKATGASAENKKAAQDKWKGLKTGKWSGKGDIYNGANNDELKNLNKLIADGMLDDLQKSGMNVEEIMTFVSSNWSVGIKKADNGNWTIPYGHGTSDAYGALNKLVKDSSKSKTADDVNQTQLKEMKKAVEQDDILGQMYKAGFTFKEAMYTLTKMFPDAGITYDINNQSTRNYGIVADNKTSGTLYKTMAEQILDHWKVGGTPAKTGDDSTSGDTNRSDPIVFQDGNTTYTFITDRDGDGKFDYSNGKDNELLGSKNGIQELLDFDYNGDGIIDEKDSKVIDGKTVYALDQLTLMSNNQIESVGENGSKDVDGYKGGANYKGKGKYTNSVDFDVTYTSARAAGITRIDLTKFKGDKNTTGSGDSVNGSTKSYDNTTEAYDDINGSSVINDFNITMNGKTFNAKETLNTEENLETFYGQVAKKAGTIYSDLSKKDVDDAYAKDYNNDVTATRNILNNLKTKLEGLKEQAGKNQDDDGTYELNIDWSKFQELYGNDGKSGTYIAMVKERATNAASQYAEDERDGVNINHKDEDANSNSSLGADATGKAMDELHEEIKVKIDDGKKK